MRTIYYEICDTYDFHLFSYFWQFGFWPWETFFRNLILLTFDHLLPKEKKFIYSKFCFIKQLRPIVWILSILIYKDIKCDICYEKFTTQNEHDMHMKKHEENPNFRDTQILVYGLLW